MMRWKMMMMNSRVRLLLIFSAILSVSACESFRLAPPAYETAQESPHHEGRAHVIALVNSIDSAQLLEEKARRRGYTFIRREVLTGLNYVMLEFHAPHGLSARAAGEELEQLEPHATADGNDVYTTSSDGSKSKPEDNEQGVSLHTPHCSIEARIGMIDGDVDSALLSSLGTRLVKRNFVHNTDLSVGIDHGTAIAQLLVGSQGQSIELYAAGVVGMHDAQQGSSVAAIVEALDWMVTADVDVVNISLAGPYNRLLDRAIQRGSATGQVIVAAVGNYGPSSPPRFPAAFEDVIAVTAVDVDGLVFDQAVQGEHVDFSALGVDVRIADHHGVRYVSGTSYAAPLITRRIAHEFHQTEHSNDNVRTHLTKQASDLGVPGRDEVFGFGLLADIPTCGTTSSSHA